MMESIQAELISLVMVIITGLAGLVAKQATMFFKQKGLLAKAENNDKVVKIVVNAVEQLYKEVGGPEKLHMAKLQLEQLMKEKQINLTATQMDMLIESAVKEMKKNVIEVKKAEVTEVKEVK